MKRVYDKVFARCPAADFIGRDSELEAILAHANASITSTPLIVLAAPRVGASELLRQAYDRLFLDQTTVAPFYFQFKTEDVSAQDAALRFASEFVMQTVAFGRRDAGIIYASPGLDELSELALPADGHWIDRVVQSIAVPGNSPSSRRLLSVPQRAAANGARAAVLIDDVHLARYLENGDRLLHALIEIFSSSLCPAVLSGQRRFLFSKIGGDIIDLEALDAADAGKFVASRAKRVGVEINDQTRDLIAVQLHGNASAMASMIDAAATNGIDLTGFDEVERTYTDEIFGGSLGRYFDSVLSRAGDRQQVIRLLSEAVAPNRSLPIAFWQKRAADQRAMDTLHNYEIVNATTSSVVLETDRQPAFLDYLRSRLRLNEEDSRALVVGNSISQNIKQAPQLMARAYRRAAAIGLKELLEAFDGRQVSPALIDYSRFKNELKGADETKIRKVLQEDNQRFRLPQIVFAAHAAAYYPPLGEIADVERVAIGVGFIDGARRRETAWLAAEIDSKLEVESDVAEFWCDRLEMAAVSCGFADFAIWLIAPEGFTTEAMEILRERKARGSSRRQVALLAEILHADLPATTVQPAAKVYELTIAAGTDGELATARQIEEIGHEHAIPAKAVNQLKTALIEACINAAEHSLSPDGIIRERFVVEPDKVTVTVSNRGVRLLDKKGGQKEEKRRGWGLKLIESLMDTVTVNDTDDGTSITMTKSFAPSTKKS